MAESHVLKTLPILVLYPHNRCNCRCVMCDIWKIDTVREISVNDLRRHAGDIKALGVGWVVFSGGEPLMHTDLFRLSDLLRSMGIRTTALRTGILLARRAHSVASCLADVALTRDEVDLLEQEIDRLIEDSRQDPGFVLDSPEKLRRIVRHFRAHLGLAEFVSPRCNAPWVSAVVESDGTVRPCFFHPSIGNARRHSLMEVLNSPQAIDFRRSLDIASNATCRRCVCSLYLESSHRR